MTEETFISTLRRYYGYNSFRGIQLDIIKSIASGHDTLGLMPTGGGKSITFQVPALTMEGVCIVVTPLIALMNDQVAHLKARGITAETISSEMRHEEILKVLDNAIYGAVKFLYVSPERLANQLFLAKLYYMKVCFITVDEAHCISQWGYDFRPAYLNIGEIREQLPHTPILALTATATPQVMQDIQIRLHFGEYTQVPQQVFTMSFKRDNIAYVVRKTDNKEEEIKHILNSVDGSAIIYTRNRDKTKQLAEELNKDGLNATYFHAGLDFAIKNRHQEQWQNNDIRIIVATNAFGMGIDKPDVRIVIHADCPDSIEAYFQEAGRAGRDGQKSYAVLLYNKLDKHKLNNSLSETFPPKEYIRKVYDNLAYFFSLAIESGEGARYEFNEYKFCTSFKHYPTTLHGALTLLQNAGYIKYDQDPDSHPRVHICIRRDELYTIHNNTSSTEDAVLSSLMRHYGTLFVELAYINEHAISSNVGITEQQLHTTLKQLSQRGIIKYVPRRTVPVITYLKQRIDSDRLIISRNIYEDQRERYQARIASIIHYAETETKCRQRLLLEYFGQDITADCLMCDVCLKYKKENKEKLESAKTNIRTLLQDGKQHHVSSLLSADMPTDLLHKAIAYMVADGELSMDGPFITWRS